MSTEVKNIRNRGCGYPCEYICAMEWQNMENGSWFFEAIKESSKGHWRTEEHYRDITSANTGLSVIDTQTTDNNSIIDVNPFVNLRIDEPS